MLWGEITPCSLSGILGSARVAEKKARGLRLGEMENVGAALRGKGNIPPRTPGMLISLPRGSVAPSLPFAFSSVKPLPAWAEIW